MAIQTNIPYINGYFPVEWRSLSNVTHSRSSLDIIASKSSSYAAFQVPFEISFPIRRSENLQDYPPGEGMPVISYGFGAPIVVWNPIVMQHERGFHIELRVDIRITCQSGESEERFVIRLPDRAPQLPNPEDVTFTVLGEDEGSSGR